jgi:ornithine carbamoyltransferase
MSPPVPILKAAAPDLLRDLDLTTGELLHLLDLADHAKAHPSRYSRALEGKNIAMLFEKPSLRTKLTFELAIKQLGGDSVTSVGPIAEREPVKDVARNLDRWTHAIAARVFSQETVDQLAEWSSVPVINALSDLYHPCQALADVLTLKEQLGELKGKKVAFVGDGNNVAHSLMLTAGRLGVHVAVATPERYAPNASIAAEAAKLGRITITNDPAEALTGAHAVYTDVWASMGQETEAAERARIFTPYQVNEDLFAKARPDAVFLHCLPAKRGQEVTDAVMESPRSVVFDQAENRLHAQKALLLMLLG